MNSLRQRDSVVCVIVLATAFLFVCGCGRRAGPQAEPPIGPRVVTIYNWEEYISPAVLSNFVRLTGIQVRTETFKARDELVARLRSNPAGFDVVVVDDSVVGLFRTLDLIQKIDPAKTPNRGNLDERYLGRSSDPSNDYSVPYLWGTTLLAYRADRVAGTPRSWSLLWDSAYAGRIMTLSDMQEVAGVAALSIGCDLNTHDPADLDAIRAQVLRQTPLLRAYADTITIRDALVSGECWAAAIYSGDAVQAAAANPAVRYILPEEGAPMWIDNFCIPRDARHVEEAHAFINFMLDAGVAAQNANELHYATPNRAALPLIHSVLAEDPALYPDEKSLARCGFYETPDQPRERYFMMLWAAILDRQKQESGGPP